MNPRSALIEPHRPGKLLPSESVTIWPILVVATLGFIIFGAVLIFVARSTIERQTDHWIETSLRASATTAEILVESKMTQASQIVHAISTRIVIRDFLLHRPLHENPKPDGTTPKADLLLALKSTPDLLGITLLDSQGEMIERVGIAPDPSPGALKADGADGADVTPTSIAGIPVFQAMSVVDGPEGNPIGREVAYLRMETLANAFNQDLGFGPGLTNRMSGVIQGAPMWLLPRIGPLSPDELAMDTTLLSSGSAVDRLLHDSHHAISGIRLAVPNSRLVIALDLDAQMLQHYYNTETSFLTVLMMSLTLICASGMTILLKPLALRLIRQRQQLDRTINELRRSEEFNRRITANIPDRIEILDRDGRVVSMSEGGAIAGEVSELAARRGANWLSFWNAEDLKLAIQALTSARSKNLGRFQGFCDRGTGTSRWWDVAVAPMLDAKGEVNEFLVVSRDITEEKIAERTITESERRYQMVASATNNVIWDWTISTNSMWWNDAIHSQFGYPAGSVGKTAAWWSERVHPDDLKRVQDGIQQVIDSMQTAWRAEYRFRKADGSYIHVLDRGHVLRDDAGKAVRMIGALVDLSDRRRAIELERRRSLQSQLRADVSAALVLATTQSLMLQACADALLRQLPIAMVRIWILDPNGTTLKLAAKAGLSSAPAGSDAQVPLGQGLIGQLGAQRLGILINEDSDPRLAEPAWIRQQGVSAFAGYPLLAGEVHIGVLGIYARQNVESDTVDSLAAIADLIAQGVRRNDLEQQLSRQAATMKRTNTELEQFTYVASHDLQEPLRTIANYLSLLDRKYHDQFDDKSRRHIDYSIAAAKRLQALIRDLLALSRSGHPESAALERVQGNEAFATAVANLESAIAEAKATVERGELPTVTYSSTHLVQLLQNLIGNAIKYRGPQPPKVRVSVAARDHEWEWTVADNGIGIDPAYNNRIFEVFQRLHGREIYQGTGIGLALCKKIVESHGGRIWVESQLGQGSTFRFTSPR